MGRAARLLRLRRLRLHAVEGVAAEPARRAPARGGRPLLRRRARRHAGRRRPGRTGRASGPSSSSPTSPATATSSGPCATRTTGGAPNGITGEDLPYLDAIEAVVAVDIDSRANALRSGEFDIMHTANAETIAEILDDDGLETVVERPLRRDQLHHAQRRPGHEPHDRRRDRPRGRQRRQPDAQPALPPGAGPRDRPRAAGRGARRRHHPRRPTVPFPPGSRGYLEDSGYPAYDLDAAQTEMDTCLAGAGHRQHRLRRSTPPTTRSTSRRTR